MNLGHQALELGALDDCLVEMAQTYLAITDRHRDRILQAEASLFGSSNPVRPEQDPVISLVKSTFNFFDLFGHKPIGAAQREQRLQTKMRRGAGREAFQRDAGR